MGGGFNEPFYLPVTADRRTAVETKLNEIRAQLYRHGGGYSREDVAALLRLSAELTALLRKLSPSSTPTAPKTTQGRTWPKRRKR
jgi:hypothetical protein